MSTYRKVPKKNKKGHKLYGPSHMTRLSLIKNLDCGFKIVNELICTGTNSYSTVFDITIKI